MICLCVPNYQTLHLTVKIPTRNRARNSMARLSRISSQLGGDSRPEQPNQQLNLSVLRFTLGVPGLDESYLPRWLGYGFGSLLVLNHFFGSSDVTSPQLRTEALGISLAAFSITLPYLGKFLKGASPVDQTSIPEGSEQIFVISESTSNSRKEDLAWATYTLLRNTSTITALVSVRGELCARGYWNTQTGLSKPDLLDWFTEQIEKIGLSDVNATLYFPQISDSGLWEMLPKGTRSVLVQPFTEMKDLTDKADAKNEGFILLATTIGYAYSDKDRAWIGALAKKIGGERP